MNKYQKMAVVALIGFGAISAQAKIGDTQDQVIAFAQKQEDIAAIRPSWYAGHARIDVIYTDNTTLAHIFGENGREIVQYIYAPKRYTDAQIKSIQHLYHTSWRGTGVTNGIYGWQSASNLSMTAARYPQLDCVTLWDMNHIGEINVLNQNAFKAAHPVVATPQQPGPVVVPQNAPSDENDCAVVATEKYALLKRAGVWVGMARFSEATLAPVGHAIVIWQPSAESNVFIYLGKNIGTIEVNTRSHDLGEIFAALNNSFGNIYKFELTRWTAI